MADGICGNVDFDEPLDRLCSGAATCPVCIDDGGPAAIDDDDVNFGALGKLLRDCIGLAPTFDGGFFVCTFGLG